MNELIEYKYYATRSQLLEHVHVNVDENICHSTSVYFESEWKISFLCLGKPKLSLE